MKQYKLMTSLYGHTGDVKSLCASRDPGGFVSVSRDLMAKLWQPQNPESSNQYIQTQTITSHKKYVNAVVIVYSLPDYPNGLIVTGSNDQCIAVHDIESNVNVAQLKEHDGAVCTLYFDNSSGKNLLYSGSFDSSAKVWNLNDLLKSDFKLKSSVTIKEHTHTVWNVLAVDKRGMLLTASADKTIKQFGVDVASSKYTFEFKYTGHTDCVRGLCMSPWSNDREFFSCSNDGTVIHWRVESATPLRQIPVTGSFLYSINSLRLVDDTTNSTTSCCHVITSGEDRSLRVHKIGPNSAEMVQCIVLPCQTLWYALELSNGVIAVACSDGSIRLFTQKEQLMAPKSELESYEKELASFAISTKTDEKLSEIKLNDLPGIEALDRPGRKDGQSIVVNNNNEAEVYTWEASEMRWVKIGVAVGSSGSGGGGGGARQKTSYLGKEYDYVFDIELDDTKSALKLPYNVSEDPYHAAQKFIHEHELSQYFLDQIAQFIINNTKSETIGDASQGSTYYDPFTGENRYVPGSESSNGRPNPSGFLDPFTGSGAYTTGGSANGSRPSQPEIIHLPKPPVNEYFPHLEFILFDQINAELVFKKARELQQKVTSGYQGDLTKLESLIANLDKIKSEADFSNELDSLFQMLSSWPKDCVFPILDLLRIVVLNSHVAEHVISSTPSMTVLLSHVSPDAPVNSMLVARCLVNLFKSYRTIADSKAGLFFLSERHNIIKLMNELSASENKSFHIAFATLLLNYVVMVKKMSANEESCVDLATLNEIVIEFVQYFNELAAASLLNWDGEALFRVLVAFGTLVAKTSGSRFDHSLIRTIAKSMDGFRLACQDVNAKAQKFPPKVAECARLLLNEF